MTITTSNENENEKKFISYYKIIKKNFDFLFVFVCDKINFLSLFIFYYIIYLSTQLMNVNKLTILDYMQINNCNGLNLIYKSLNSKFYLHYF